MGVLEFSSLLQSNTPFYNKRGYFKAYTDI